MRFTISHRMGLELLLDAGNLIDRVLLSGAEWEGEQLRFLEDLSRGMKQPGARMIFLDIGAHWGLYALRMHKTGFFNSITAFEPDPFNFAQLEAQLFLNQCA